MNPIQTLLSRNSTGSLHEPGPNAEELELIIQAGLRACDHGNLKPWQFLLIEGEARNNFGELLVSVKEAQEGSDFSEEEKSKLRLKPLRAPTILVVAAKICDHPKVPEIEQLLSAGAAAQMMVTAAHMLGLGAIWRSGQLMFEAATREGLGLSKDHRIVGFLYIGTPKNYKPLPLRNSADFLSVWKGRT